MRRFSAFPLLLTLLLVHWVLPTRAQPVPRAVVVEHFTNSRCSICFNRNPGFYANLRQQPNSTLHVAYHPSAPYALCVFSQQNPVENDARTNFYGVYGSTPRLVLNGRVVPAAQDYAAPALFAAATGQTSPLVVQTALMQQTADSLAVTVTIQAAASHALTGLTLYVALVEDTVFYAAPNGEAVHYDVFRKSFSGPQPEPITLSALGSVLTLRRTVAVNPLWSVPRLYAIALVQKAGGELEQAGASARLGAAPLGTANSQSAASFSVYPNPVRETLYLPATDNSRWRVTNTLGQEIAHGTAVSIDVRAWPRGTYLLHAPSRRVVRFLKE